MNAALCILIRISRKARRLFYHVVVLFRHVHALGWTL